jgi:transcription elongation GreA/GreB family factor
MSELAMDADEGELRSFAKRILGALYFDELSRRALMGRMIKARPEMQSMMEDSAQRDSTITVSWESLEQRKLDLEDLVKNKIPQNKKDIQIAREYGDLRENFEYKSARQQQGFLMRLQHKYERELRQARGTDFVGVSTDKVGVGTIVEFEDLESGEKETFTILGAWDSVPEKHIISYLSGIAKALIGKAVGDEAELPTEENAPARRVRVLSIRAYKTAADAVAG